MKSFSTGPMENNTFVGCAMRCDACGGIADVIEGTFDHIGDTIRVRSAPPRTHDILRALHKAASSVENGEDTESVIAELEKETPEFAKLARFASKKGGKVAVMYLLAFLISQCQLKIDATVDLNLLLAQAHSYMTENAPYSEIQPPASDPTPHEQKSDLKKDRLRQLQRQARKQRQRSAQQKPPAPSKPKR
jgi:hypothetical protein